MVITTTFNNIGWGAHADDVITITEYFSPSNDYEGTVVSVNGVYRGGSTATSDALINALGSDLGGWLLRHMGAHTDGHIE